MRTKEDFRSENKKSLTKKHPKIDTAKTKQREEQDEGKTINKSFQSNNTKARNLAIRKRRIWNLIPQTNKRKRREKGKGRFEKKKRTTWGTSSRQREG